MLSAVLASLVAVLPLASCSSIETRRDAAVVNGMHLSSDEFNTWITSAFGQEWMQVGADQTQSGVFSGGTARELVNGWVVVQLVRSAVGAKLDTKAAEQALSTNHPTTWSDAPATLKQFAVENSAAYAMAQAGQLDELTIRRLIATANVHVDPRIGVWDGTKVVDQLNRA